LVDTCKLKLIECSDDDCYFEKARFEMDVSLCSKIMDVDKVSKCNLLIIRSQILQNAVLKDEIKICTEFSDLSDVEFCYDNYYISKRFNENDVEFCEMIKNEVIKNECEK